MDKGKEMLAGCIQRKRVALMVAYQDLFTASKDGQKSVYERWMSDEIPLSSKEGKKVMKDIMKLEVNERQLATLQESYQMYIYKEVESRK